MHRGRTHSEHTIRSALKSRYLRHHHRRDNVLMIDELVSVRKRTDTSRVQGCARKPIDVSH